MRTIKKIFACFAIVLMFALIAGHTDRAMAKSAKTVAPVQDNSEVKEAFSKLSDEMKGLAGDLKAADSGKAAAAALLSRLETLKPAHERTKPYEKTVLESEAKAKEMLGEDGAKKFLDAFGEYIGVALEVSEKYKDDADFKAAYEKFESVMK